MSSLPSVSAFLLSFLLFITAASTFRLDSKARDVSPSPSSPIDLIDPTHNVIQDSLSNSMKASLKTLRDLESSPSCNKVATAALIHSCSTLDGSVTPTDNDITRGIDLVIQEEINVYAARLAICELNSAKASVPPACKAFVPTFRSTERTSWAGYLTRAGPSKPRQMYPDYDEITEESLAQCLSALHSSGQAWTSFTSSKTSALLMCQSMRGEIDRDHTIHLHKILASTTEDVVDALFASKQDWAEFQAGFAEMASSMRSVHLDLVQDDEQRLAAARRVWAEHYADVQQGFDNLLTRVQDIQLGADNAYASVNTHIRHAGEGFQQMSDLAVQHGQDMRSVSAEAGTALELVQYLEERIQQHVLQAVYSLTQHLQTANDTAFDFSGALTDSAGRLDSFKEAADHADRLKTNLEWFTDLVDGNWSGVLRVVPAFVGYTTVFTLLGVGIWQRVMPSPGYICASLASGLVLAYVWTAYVSPLEALRHAFNLLSSTARTAAFTFSPVLCMSIAAVTFALIFCIHRLIAGRWLPRLRHQQTSNDFEADTPGRRAIAFRLPVNDPRRVAEMAERRAMREAGDLKRWEV
ncbi:hypothetical protein LTR85_002664 [Meristemomyces frigidus]|nr:hypothetical protein LTR85_002664 [Meristemomyces frigidus]